MEELKSQQIYQKALEEVPSDEKDTIENIMKNFFAPYQELIDSADEKLQDEDFLNKLTKELSKLLGTNIDKQ